MPSSGSSNSNNAESPSTIKIVISVLAFLGFLAFLVAGLIYMSHKYSPRPSDIIVRLHSLTVKHLFRVQGASPLLAIWDANISIHNHRDGKDPHREKDMNIIIRDLQSILYYKDHGVSCAMHAKPMLEIKSEKWAMVRLEFKAKNCGIKDNSKVVDKFERKMREERRRGHLRMSMKMNMVVSTDFLRSPNSTGRYWRTDVRCSHEFDVVYVHGIRQGRMVGHDLNLWYHKCNIDTKMIHSQHTDGKKKASKIPYIWLSIVYVLGIQILSLALSSLAVFDFQSKSSIKQSKGQGQATSSFSMIRRNKIKKRTKTENDDVACL